MLLHLFVLSLKRDRDAYQALGKSLWFFHPIKNIGNQITALTFGVFRFGGESLGTRNRAFLVAAGVLGWSVYISLVHNYITNEIDAGAKDLSQVPLIDTLYLQISNDCVGSDEGTSTIAVMQTELTRGIYAKSLGVTSVNRPLEPQTLSWTEANEFVVWLNEATQAQWRLPTHEEWVELASASIILLERPHLCDFVMVSGSTVSSEHCGQQFKPAEVGSYPPDGAGLYDMLGNVKEWTSTCAVEVVDEGDCSTYFALGGSFSSLIGNSLEAEALDKSKPRRDVGVRLVSGGEVLGCER